MSASFNWRVLWRVFEKTFSALQAKVSCCKTRGKREASLQSVVYGLRNTSAKICFSRGAWNGTVSSDNYLGNSSPATFENRTLISEVSKKKKHFRCVDNSKFLFCFIQTLPTVEKQILFLDVVKDSQRQTQLEMDEFGRRENKLQTFPRQKSKSTGSAW